MKSLRRARLGLGLAVVFALCLLGAELPLSELLHQRTQLGVVDAQLAALDARNASLQADITALSHASTLGAIAHEQYGLVRPGQRSYVILPGANDPQASTLRSLSIPPQDLVAAPPGASGALPGIPGHPAGPGFWSRVAERLEFWRWAF